MADIEEKIVKHREAIEKLVESCAQDNPEYAERLRAQLDSVQPGLDDLQDMLSDAQLGGTPPEEDEASGEGETESEREE